MHSTNRLTGNAGRVDLNPNDYLGRGCHSYELEAQRLHESGRSTIERRLVVNARSRAQARSLAERAGYIVQSVNMVG